MQRRRPTAVLVMGILNIVFGSLSVGCCGVFGFVKFRDEPNMQWWAKLREQVPSFEAIAAVEIVGQSLLGGLLIVAGSCLLGMAPWARLASILYAVLTFGLSGFILVYELAVINPWKRRLIKFAFADDWVTVMKTLPLMTYAVVLLVMMLLPHVSAAFRGEPTDGWEPDWSPPRWDDDGSRWREGHWD